MLKPTITAILIATSLAWAAPSPASAAPGAQIELVQHHRHYDRGRDRYERRWHRGDRRHDRRHDWRRHRPRKVCRIVKERGWRHHHRVWVNVRRCHFVR
ncbi:hypothetical protein [Consotaella salsifontis]|uniref:Uncharacterized protein n=1 Tax=Consotaella salsifontis TaxID=1365950 RepID=A0A1T4LVC2_9HYPH|nr:hypothetical protein [Consotaella salsifontis]SJZ58581.1 hypothetical protein SAMN05428963_101374 [Consotaella salsifontis]